MALSIDTSTVVDTASASSLINTTASFTAPAASRLIALVTTNAASAIEITPASITNSGTALTWTRRAAVSLSNSSGQGGTGATIYEAWNASSQNITVSITPNASAVNSAYSMRAKVVICTGDEGVSFSGATAVATNASGIPSASLSAAAGSYLLAVAADWNTMGNGTAGSGTTIFLDRTDALYSSHWLISSTTTTSGTNTLSLTAPSGEDYNMAMIEIKALNAGGLQSQTIAWFGN